MTQEEALELFAPLITATARKHPLLEEDVRQEASLAVCEAVAVIDSERSKGEIVNFVARAVLAAVSELVANDASMPVPRTTLRRYAEGELSPEMAAAVRSASSVESLSSFVEEGGAGLFGEEEHGLLERLKNVAPGAHDPVSDTATRNVDLHHALDTLTEREREVLTLSFGLDGSGDRSTREVAAELGISQPRVAVVQKRALGKLEEAMCPS